MPLSFPYRISPAGVSATSAGEAHLQELVEQLLFTAPGERINRPDFGTGLLQLVFEPANDALSATLEVMIRGALQQSLGDVLEIGEVDVAVEDAVLRVMLGYRPRGESQRRELRLERAL